MPAQDMTTTYSKSSILARGCLLVHLYAKPFCRALFWQQRRFTSLVMTYGNGGLLQPYESGRLFKGVGLSERDCDIFSFYVIIR